MTNTITDTSFIAINDIAEKADYYTTLSALDRATVSLMLFNASYNSIQAKRINPNHPKRYQWDTCHEMASYVIKYCQAAKGFLDSWASDYKYAVNLDGSFIDNEQGVRIPRPHGSLKCLVEAANLFDEAFHEVYKNHSKCTDIVKIHRLAMFANGMEKVIQKASGRAKAAKVMALYREMLRHRNTVYAIKNNI